MLRIKGLPVCRAESACAPTEARQHKRMRTNITNRSSAATCCHRLASPRLSLPLLGPPNEGVPLLGVPSSATGPTRTSGSGQTRTAGWRAGRRHGEDAADSESRLVTRMPSDEPCARGPAHAPNGTRVPENGLRRIFI